MKTILLFCVMLIAGCSQEVYHVADGSEDVSKKPVVADGSYIGKCGPVYIYEIKLGKVDYIVAERNGGGVCIVPKIQ